jgi:hypothetical protein
MMRRDLSRRRLDLYLLELAGMRPIAGAMDARHDGYHEDRRQEDPVADQERAAFIRNKPSPLPPHDSFP